jgi:hypothetical protein
MRTFLMTAALVAIGSLAGCMHTHSHGICDCDLDDHCTSRSPWVRTNTMAAPVQTAPVEKVAPPQKLPDVKKKTDL